MTKKKVVKPGSGSSGSGPKKLRFDLRSGFEAELLPFTENIKEQFTNINDSIPIISHLEKSKIWQKRNFGKPPAKSYRLLDPVKNVVELEYNDEKVLVYQKVIHLMDAYRSLRYGEGYPEKNYSQLWGQSDLAFLNNPNNQAYVDVAASFLASSLHEQFESPHFVKFYQTFRAVSKNYKLNITEDISHYRYTNWFWESFDKKNFRIEVREKSSETLLSDEEVLQLLRPDSDLCCDSDSEDSSGSGSGSGSDTSCSAESLSDIENNTETKSAELESVDNFDCENDKAEVIYRHSCRGNTVNNNSDSDGSDETDFDEYLIHAIINNMPVAVLHTEKMSGNMDELMDLEDFSEGWEAKWTAWTFQIVVALNQLQHHYNLIHNDLHTNNIVWKDTELEHYTYKNRAGKLFKVPTYGKRFAIIDFGRATFLFNGVEISSSDFRDGADAEGQYNFGPWRNKDEATILPNPSFDLCRLSCSLTRTLFPKNPEKKEGGLILSRDGKTAVHETTSEFFNMLWTWLVDSKGKNVLEDDDGDERFPGFDLYQHIAENCRKAKPEDWINKPIFKNYVIEETDKDVILIP